MALPLHNFLSHLHFFRVGEIILKYGNLMLPAGHILDLYCVWPPPPPERGKILVPFFQKVPFLANIKRCPKFLEYALTRGISRQSYLWYWFYRWSGSSVLCSSCKNTFVGAGNLQMITSKFWFEYLWGLMYSFWTHFCV